MPTSTSTDVLSQATAAVLRDEPGDLSVGMVGACQDDLPSGIGVTYFVDESDPYVAISQVRKL